MCPYLEALEPLTDYVALNRPDPPDLDALPPAHESSVRCDMDSLHPLRLCKAAKRS